MKTLLSKKAALFALALFVGMVALSAIMHDDSQAVGTCSTSCRCVTCGTAASPTRACVDFVSFCRGPRLVRNCAEYCSHRWSSGQLPPID